LGIPDPYNITDNKVHRFIYFHSLLFYFNNKKALKVENKNYSHKQFSSSKKKIKTLLEIEKIGFLVEEDVKRLLTKLLE
jgi:hypothetical protein